MFDLIYVRRIQRLRREVKFSRIFLEPLLGDSALMIWCRILSVNTITGIEHYCHEGVRLVCYDDPTVHRRQGLFHRDDRPLMCLVKSTVGDDVSSVQKRDSGVSGADPYAPVYTAFCVETQSTTIVSSKNIGDCSSLIMANSLHVLLGSMQRDQQTNDWRLVVSPFI
ncbi:hypothetical protein TNCV_426281 [Trichonephila clavipes]|nr:hypothetical protein TNCV_426281 [Trichonephila clavipes]